MFREPNRLFALNSFCRVCVSDTKAVEQVLFGPNGAVQALDKGAVVADSSTISPSASIQFAAKIRERGCDFLDAPVTGSKIAAEGGSLIFIVGGSEVTIARVQPLFDAMGKKLIHMGKNGLRSRPSSPRTCKSLS